MNDVVLNKHQSIQRCVQRASVECEADPAGFRTNFTLQEAALLDILRTCEQTLELANNITKTHKFDVPSSSGRSFDLLLLQGVIDEVQCDRLRRMTHFRNLLMRDNQSTDLDVLESVLATELDDLLTYWDCVRKRQSG